MVDRIKALFPLFFILIIIGALINIGAIPGKEPILRFLGLSKNNLQEEARPLDYVPDRLLELSSPSSYEDKGVYIGPPGETEDQSPQQPATATPSPSQPNQQDQPPPPPPFVLGTNTSQEPPIPLDFSEIPEDVNTQVEDEGFWQTIKDYLSGIF